jgi:hypothetical protein
MVHLKKLRKSEFADLQLYYIDGRYIFLTLNDLVELEWRLGFPEETIEPLETYQERRKKFIPFEEKRKRISDYLNSKRLEDREKFGKEWVILNMKSDEAKDYFATVLDYHFKVSKYGYLMRRGELGIRGDQYYGEDIEWHDHEYDPQNYFSIVCKRRFRERVNRFSTVIHIDKRKIESISGIIGMTISVWGEAFRLECRNLRSDRTERSIRLIL